MENKEYSSESEQSDEDYCPTKDVDGGANDVSEDDSDGDPISDEDTTKPQSRKKSSINKSTDQKTISSDDKIPEEAATDDKAHVDALWADFLFGTDSAYTKKTDASTTKQNDTKITSKFPVDKQIITERVEFAGETINIEKEIQITPAIATSTLIADAPVEKLTPPLKKPNFSPKPSGLLKRPSGGGGVGLSSVLNQISKKSKISVLEKTKLDWNSFKRNEGIDEQLNTHNKGKDGYLERQDFLERTDLRQFEIEKNLRQTSRKSNR